MLVKRCFSILALISNFISFSQNGWNWPLNENLFFQAQEKQAYYKVLMDEGKYAEAFDELQWFYENNANLNPSIYIDGIKCAEKIMEKNKDEEQVAKVQEKSLWMFDQRINYFGNNAKVIGRKAYAAFKYYYKNPQQYPLLFELFEKAFDLDRESISDFNLVPYMTVAKYGNDWRLINEQEVLEIYTTVKNVILFKEENGKNMSSHMEKIHTLIRSLSVFNCQFIEEEIIPKFRQNPYDIDLAKKIVVYSVDADCSDQKYFLDASELVIQSEPEYKFCMLIANKQYVNGDYLKAGLLYNKGLELALINDQKFDAIMGQAKVANKKGQKNLARSLARQALTYKPRSPEVFNFIGNLYFQSFNDCANYETQLNDRLVYIAAYEQFKKAGNTSRMNAAKEQFPSINDIFNEGKKEGDQMSTGCWIAESVTLRRR